MQYNVIVSLGIDDKVINLKSYMNEHGYVDLKEALKDMMSKEEFSILIGLSDKQEIVSVDIVRAKKK